LELRLGLLGAAVAAGLLLLPEGPQARLDRSTRRGSTFPAAAPPKAGSRARIRVLKRNAASGRDNSNSSYAALGLPPEPAWLPEQTPAWLRVPAGRLDGAFRVILTLKERCRKVILAGVV
jgi:hypothetical protein